MEKSLSESALQFVNAMTTRSTSGNSTLPDTEVAIQAASQQYESTVNSIAATKQGNAVANTKLSDTVAGKATTFGASISGDPGMMTVYTTALNAYQAQQGRATTTYATPLGTQRQDDGGNILAKLFSSPGQALTEAITNISRAAKSTRFIKMKNLGITLLASPKSVLLDT